jgi:predicted glycosyl hydrolase (DUF1957 family)
MARKLTDTVHLRLRFDEKLRRRLEREAVHNRRSMNAEIIDRLEKSFAKADQAKLLEAIATTSATKALEILGASNPRRAVPALERRDEHLAQGERGEQKEKGQ